MEEAVVMSVVVVLYAVFIICSIAQYIMSSLSLFTLARRRGLPNPILAWIPVADVWLLGQLADDYDEKSTGKKNWGKVMLTLTIVGIGMFFAFYVAIIIVALVAAASGAASDGVAVVISLVIVYLMIIVAAMVLNVAMLLKTICTYKVFESTVPNKAVLYTALSAVVPLAGGICLLKVKDKGYPEECDVIAIEEVAE